MSREVYENRKETRSRHEWIIDRIHVKLIKNFLQIINSIFNDLATLNEVIGLFELNPICSSRTRFDPSKEKNQLNKVGKTTLFSLFKTLFKLYGDTY